MDILVVENGQKKGLSGKKICPKKVYGISTPEAETTETIQGGPEKKPAKKKGSGAKKGSTGCETGGLNGVKRNPKNGTPFGGSIKIGSYQTRFSSRVKDVSLFFEYETEKCTERQKAWLNCVFELIRNHPESESDLETTDLEPSYEHNTGGT